MKKLNLLVISVMSCLVASCATQPTEKPKPLDSKTLSGSVWGVDLKAKRKSANSYTISAVSKLADRSKYTVVEAWECAAEQLAEGRTYEKSLTTKPEYYFIADNGQVKHLAKSLSASMFVDGDDYDETRLPGGVERRMWTAHGTMTIK